MESYIEYLTDTNKSIDLEMNKYLEGGSLLEIDGGFPQFYECISNSEQKYTDNSDTDREKARSKTNINKNSLSNVLDNRRKTPFISVEKNTNIVNRIDVDDNDEDENLLETLGVNSDSILQNNLEGGNTENNYLESSVELPNNLSILSNKNILESKEMSLNNNLVEENNLDITDIFVKKENLEEHLNQPSQIDVVDVNADSDTQLPSNIEIHSINNVQVQEGGITENLENINAVSDSIALPENINIVDIKGPEMQEGGNIENIDTVSDSIALPENINIVDIQKGGDIENLEDITSETIELPEFINIVDIDTVEVQQGGNIENLEDITSETVELPEFINIVDINTVQEGGNIENLEDVNSDSIFLPENIDIVDIVVQDGGDDDKMLITSGSDGILLKRGFCIGLEKKLNKWQMDNDRRQDIEVTKIGDALYKFGLNSEGAVNNITVSTELLNVIKDLLKEFGFPFTIMPQDGGDIENLEDVDAVSDSIALPENINIVDIVDLQEGGDVENLEDVTSETVTLPEFINIVDIDTVEVQQGGDLEDIASETELELPQNIEIINIV